MKGQLTITDTSLHPFSLFAGMTRGFSDWPLPTSGSTDRKDRERYPVLTRSLLDSESSRLLGSTTGDIALVLITHHNGASPHLSTLHQTQQRGRNSSRRARVSFSAPLLRLLPLSELVCSATSRQRHDPTADLY